MHALLAVAAFGHVVAVSGVSGAAAPSLAPRVPRMTGPVVHVRSVKHVHLSSLPWLGELLPSPTQYAVGSGFIIDAGGLILTNDHVVDKADRVVVTVDERELPAEVIGRDHDLDVALLRVDAGRPLVAARLGHSHGTRVGDFVVAVGNPFGLDRTVTSGIVSARTRIISDGAGVPLLQTDASINPGNSGGPLYDLQGNVIGINTAIVAGASGIGFAVPIDFVRRALPQLRASGHVSPGFLGVRVGSVTPEVAIALGLSRLGVAPRGALITAVVPDGPGARAGLRPGDVIVRWDGERVETSETLPPNITLSPPGSVVKVKLVRDGSPISLDVLMGRKP